MREIDEEKYFVSTENDKLLRNVKPYLYTFYSNVKQRWINRSILEIFTEEFGGNDSLYYQQAIELGLILVNKKQCETTYLIKSSDKITHTVYMYEPPVQYIPVKDIVIKNTDDFLVVNKPASIPVHPCGSYRRNSLIDILKAEYPDQANTIRPVHRLDRLTSGIIVFAKTNQIAKEIMKAMNPSPDDVNYKINKIYIVLVHGHFPHTSETQDKLLTSFKISKFDFKISNKQSKEYLKNLNVHNIGLSKIKNKNIDLDIDAINSLEGLREESSFVFSWPLRCANKRNGCWECVSQEEFERSYQDGSKDSYKRIKQAMSEFTLLKHISTKEGEKYSVLLAKPLTGRTHQLRLHLKKLGYPIVSDPNYGIEGNIAQEKVQQRDQLRSSFTNKRMKLDIETLKSESLEIKARTINNFNLGGLAASFNNTQLRYTAIGLHALSYDFQLGSETVYKFSTPLPLFISDHLQMDIDYKS